DNCAKTTTEDPADYRHGYSRSKDWTTFRTMYMNRMNDHDCLKAVDGRWTYHTPADDSIKLKPGQHVYTQGRLDIPIGILFGLLALFGGFNIFWWLLT